MFSPRRLWWFYRLPPPLPLRQDQCLPLLRPRNPRLQMSSPRCPPPLPVVVLSLLLLLQ